jgi:hypothetical protein
LNKRTMSGSFGGMPVSFSDRLLRHSQKNAKKA